MAFSCDYLLLLLFYVLIFKRICNCEPIYNNSEDESNMSKWYYSPEIGKFIIRNSSMTTANIFSQDSYTRLEEIIPSNAIIGIIDEPQCPDGERYCENIPNYPHQLLHEVLKSNTFKKNLFSNQNTFSSLRGAGLSEDDTVCRSIREIIRPMIASNEMGNRKFILNQENEEEFVQEIHVEKCQPGIGLANRCGYNPLDKNKKTGCKQKYLSWRLLSFSLNGKVSFDTFSFPSGCSCIYI